MKAEKIIYDGDKRIKVDFPYNQELASQIKTISGARWSRTLSAWHIPYTQEAFNLLKKLFPEVDYPKKNLNQGGQSTSFQGMILSFLKLLQEYFDLFSVSTKNSLLRSKNFRIQNGTPITAGGQFLTPIDLSKNLKYWR